LVPGWTDAEDDEKWRREEGRAAQHPSTFGPQGAANLRRDLRLGHGTYDDERRSYQTAFASLKHTHEKVGDHWEPKDEYGPSDPRAAEDRPNDSDTPTAGGVDANATKQHLYELATRLEVKGRSRMSKAQLVDALQKANNRASAKARS
jgi:hypothetical protein